MSDLRIPDYINPLIGWRCLTYKEWKGTLYLTSGHSHLWKPFERAESWCHGHFVHDPKVPDVNCQCGFYSFKTFDQLAESNYSKVQPIVVRLNNWGTVIDCQNGYRSQYAYPKDAAINDERIAEMVRKQYGIPCDVGDIFGRMRLRKQQILDEVYSQINDRNVPWHIQKALRDKYGI